MHPEDITAHHIVRRVDNNEVKLLANLVPQVAPGSLLDATLAEQHNVFKYYWARSQAESFALQTS
jgi:hypothetical protein